MIFNGVVSYLIQRKNYKLLSNLNTKIIILIDSLDYNNFNSLQYIFPINFLQLHCNIV